MDALSEIRTLIGDESFVGARCAPPLVCLYGQRRALVCLLQEGKVVPVLVLDAPQGEKLFPVTFFVESRSAFAVIERDVIIFTGGKSERICRLSGLYCPLWATKSGDDIYVLGKLQYLPFWRLFSCADNNGSLIFPLVDPVPLVSVSTNYNSPILMGRSRFFRTQTRYINNGALLEKNGWGATFIPPLQTSVLCAENVGQTLICDREDIGWKWECKRGWELTCFWGARVGDIGVAVWCAEGVAEKKVRQCMYAVWDCRSGENLWVGACNTSPDSVFVEPSGYIYVCERERIHIVHTDNGYCGEILLDSTPRQVIDSQNKHISQLCAERRRGKIYALPPESPLWFAYLCSSVYLQPAISPIWGIYNCRLILSPISQSGHIERTDTQRFPTGKGGAGRGTGAFLS